MSLQDPRIRSFHLLGWRFAEKDCSGGIDRPVEVLSAGIAICSVLYMTRGSTEVTNKR